MNKAKAKSKSKGTQFLREAFASEMKVLALELDLSGKSITHDGVMGEVNEQHFIRVLRKYLPRRYAVEHGIVIDSTGATSEQIDIVIFDMQYTPVLLDQDAHRYIPVEAVYCVLEAKPTINNQYIEYAGKKAESVRNLRRTSAPFANAGVQNPARKPFEILGGIIAPRVQWAAGLSSKSFLATLSAQKGKSSLQCGLALSDRAFDSYEGSLSFSGPENALVFFIFRLLQKLQVMGTVPAIDWSKYISAIGGGARS